MKFQPFGYRFEVSSTLTMSQAKAAIRAKKTKILDSKKRARGWITGPMICLWFDPFDRRGPMLFGFISRNNFGTRIYGRAGSDLNGVVYFTLLLPVLVWLSSQAVADDQAHPRALFVIGLLLLIGGPLVYWLAHSSRKDAEPLVRFLQDILTSSSERSVSSEASRETLQGLRLLLNGEALEGPTTLSTIKDALLRVGSDDFLIVEKDAHQYLQTACRDGMYILEIREGGPQMHYQAFRRSQPSDPSTAEDHLSFEEVSAAVNEYVSGKPLPASLQWQKMMLS